MADNVPDVTILLCAAQSDRQAQEKLYRLVENTLRDIATARLRNERPDSQLQPTVLINDAFMKLIGEQNVDWQNRQQFFCTAARVMRRMLVDNARQRAAQKRGGGKSPGALEAHDRQVPDPQSGTDQQLLEIDDILKKLAQTDPDLVTVVEFHHFAGWELKQIGKYLGISESTVKRRWKEAKAKLYLELTGESLDGPR